ncbi:helix-turn-helix domain-containing protein [Pectobacterium brasiliense]|uniref:helix-turn-helix domain-containing protein n=1 Tax=Pectobacterium brasiliense TaxID=180957 RepID=UPI0019692ABE|nr:helix-turn-helix domain-containing protein [Pectobacterium brasiliense]MBN3123896.1 helix-turn-helix domain-containing protein [Pectobacterium brasiliense]
MPSIYTYHQGIIDELIRWIAQQHDNPVTTAMVAERAGFSRWHMQRVFKQRTGITLGKYIKDVKLGKAVLELIRGNEPVIITALQNGYESQQTFTRAIKNYTGLTPGKIKRLPDEQKMHLLEWVGLADVASMPQRN